MISTTMISTTMSGRHRKQSNTGRTVAKIAVTSAIMGVAGAAFSGTANAAPDSDWDRLAQCESSGNWGINTGNGYAGGVQFSNSTWNEHGGTQYAATANQATREQQIVVAEKVLDSQGWGAWPTCSSNLGLNSAPTQRNAPAPVHEVSDTQTLSAPSTSSNADTIGTSGTQSLPNGTQSPPSTSSNADTIGTSGTQSVPNGTQSPPSTSSNADTIEDAIGAPGTQSLPNGTQDAPDTEDIQDGIDAALQIVQGMGQILKMFAQ